MGGGWFDGRGPTCRPLESAGATGLLCRCISGSAQELVLPFGNCGYGHSEGNTKDCREKFNSTAKELLRESSYIKGLE